MYRKLAFIFICLLTVIPTSYTQLSLRHSHETNIEFANIITETEKVNILGFDYLYNGGGIGIIDVNNDGLDDVFFSGNFVNDKLYLNQGNFKFEEVTEAYGILNNGWSTGVCIFDVNQDGFDDIYVCRSGVDSLMNGTENVLYLNQNGKGFKEASASYGLDLKINAVQAAPLDYDLDGDLDLYIITHPSGFKHTERFSSYYDKIIKGQVNSDRLLENIDGKYHDVTAKAGIFEYGYSLGIAITDLNTDQYPDIIVSNDFDEPDHVFINQGNGRFNDESLKYLKHTSNYSMGNDVGDFNNDGLLDYISLDMAFQNSKRSKLNMASMNPEKFWTRVMLGWNHQYMHNMLQLNSGYQGFKEIAYLANVAKTDWSWAPLFLDINADGWQDLIISNGYKRDTKNNDIKAMLEAYLESENDISILNFLDLIPATKIKNQLFVNQKDLRFKNETESYGLGVAVNSNGMAYADFNNDGLLDIVLNNVDTVAFVYENVLDQKSNYLSVDFSEMKPEDWIGAKLTFKTSESIQTKEAYFIRGFQSSVTKKQFFYWPKSDQAEWLQIKLASGKIARYNIRKTTKIRPNKIDFTSPENSIKLPNRIWNSIHLNSSKIKHKENDHDDFEKESLLPHKLSQNGPVIKVADFNNDQLDDLIIGSSVGEIPAIYLQDQSGGFALQENTAFYHNQLSEEEDIFIVDLNNDGHQDLIFSYGGYQYPEGSPHLKNSIYLGNGKGQFGKVQSTKIMDDLGYDSGKIVQHDFNQDGHQDFLICGLSNPMNYPMAGRTSILMNNRGNFQDFTSVVAPELARVGMVKDAVMSDVDLDGDADIVLIGEWMDLTIFINTAGRYQLMKTNFSLSGWWNRLIAYDFDGDGDDDYLVGNAGMNNKFKPSIFSPLNVYMTDFDDNSTNDIVLSVVDDHRIELPLRGKECSAGQMPFINEKFKTYDAFASSNLGEIYSREKLAAAYHKQAVEFRSGIIENRGGLKFSFHPFAPLAQLSAIEDFELIDMNADGKIDIVGIGNDFGTEVETTRNDAGTGVVLLQETPFEFKAISSWESGLYIEGNAKCIASIQLATGKKGIVIGVNDGDVHVFVLEK